MSREQVEIVREHIEAVRRRDFPRALSLFDPHVVVDMARIGGPEEDAPTCSRWSVSASRST